jgi:hypothetical protein
LPFPKKRIFRLANRKLVESKALSPRSQLQDVTKFLFCLVLAGKSNLTSYIIALY